MARRTSCGPFRTASSARRIRSVDFRTQGCAEHTFLDAHTAGLYRLCEDWPHFPLLDRTALIQHRSHGKTDAGITASCIAAARLLAPGTLCGREDLLSVD